MMPAQPYAFISYSRKDEDKVNRLCADLTLLRDRLWIDRDPQSLPYGTPDYQAVSESAIEACAVLILVATPNSRASIAVAGELQLAKIYQRPIIPFWIDGDDWIRSIPPFELSRTQYIDARGVKYPLALHALHEELKRIGVTDGSTDYSLPSLPPRREECQIVLGKVGARQRRFVAVEMDGRYPIACSTATINVEEPPERAPYTQILVSFGSMLRSEGWQQKNNSNNNARWYELQFIRDAPAGYPLASYDYCTIVINESEDGQYRFEAVSPNGQQCIAYSKSTFDLYDLPAQAPYTELLDNIAQQLLEARLLPVPIEDQVHWYTLQFARRHE